MSKPSLPSRPTETWECGFVSDTPYNVDSIEARGGTVIAGGSHFHLLKPGTNTWLMRPPPEDIGPMTLVAAEPRGARRHAVVSQAMLALFFKSKKGDQILRLKPAEPNAWISHIAWGGDKGPCALYVLRGDTTLLRMKPDLSDLEELEVETMSALASDDDGTIAMVALYDDEQRVYVTRNGVEMKFRLITPQIDPDAGVELAVAGDAVAIVVDEKYVLVSRGVEDPFQRIEILDSPEGSGWKTGPIAFQGTSNDAALFCSRWENECVRIMRVEASGAATSILELEGDATHDPPEVVSLSWDATRQTLWGASPYTGIIRCVAPSAKGKKKPVLS